MRFVSTADIRWAVFLGNGTSRCWVPHVTQVALSTSCRHNRPGEARITFPDGFRDFLYYGQEVMVFSGYEAMRCEFVGYLHRFESTVEAVFCDKTIMLDTVQLSLSIQDVSPLDIIYTAVDAALHPLDYKADRDPWALTPPAGPDAGQITNQRKPDRTKAVPIEREIERAPKYTPTPVTREQRPVGVPLQGWPLVAERTKILVADFEDLGDNPVTSIIEQQYQAATLMLAERPDEARRRVIQKSDALFARPAPGEKATTEEYSRFEKETVDATKSITEDAKVQLRPLVTAVDPAGENSKEYWYKYGLPLAGNARVDLSPLNVKGVQVGENRIPRPVLSYGFIQNVLGRIQADYGVFIHDVAATKVKRDAINYYKQTPRQIIEDVFQRWKLPWSIGVDAMGNIWIGDRRALHPSRFMAIWHPEHIIGDFREKIRYESSVYRGTRLESLGYQITSTPGRSATVMDLDPNARKWSRDPEVRARQSANYERARALGLARALTRASGRPEHARVQEYTANVIAMPGLHPMDLVAVDSAGYVGFAKMLDVETVYSYTALETTATFQPISRGEAYVATPRDKSK